MKIIDLHNHTNFSYDGISGINSLVENAVRNGKVVSAPETKAEKKEIKKPGKPVPGRYQRK